MPLCYEIFSAKRQHQDFNCNIFSSYLKSRAREVSLFKHSQLVNRGRATQSSSSCKLQYKSTTPQTHQRNPNQTPPPILPFAPHPHLIRDIPQPSHKRSRPRLRTTSWTASSNPTRREKLHKATRPSSRIFHQHPRAERILAQTSSPTGIHSTATQHEPSRRITGQSKHRNETKSAKMKAQEIVNTLVTLKTRTQAVNTKAQSITMANGHEMATGGGPYPVCLSVSVLFSDFHLALIAPCHPPRWFLQKTGGVMQ